MTRQHLGLLGVLLLFMSFFLTSCKDKKENSTAFDNSNWKVVAKTFDDGIEMVQVPKGCIELGNDSSGVYWDMENREWLDEVPKGGKVCFDADFWIDRYEVTNAQFARLGGVATRENRFEGDNRPRAHVSWWEARDFCRLRDGRLPTEAEWEYAARASSDHFYPWGKGFDAANVVYESNSNEEPADVGSKPGGVSWVGAYDMAGNVGEWTSTIYENYPYKADDGREDQERENLQRVVRGGAWNSSDLSLRSTLRDLRNPDVDYGVVGIRCVRDK